MVIDSIDVQGGVEKGLFEPPPEDKLPLGYSERSHACCPTSFSYWTKSEEQHRTA